MARVAQMSMVSYTIPSTLQRRFMRCHAAHTQALPQRFWARALQPYGKLFHAADGGKSSRGANLPSFAGEFPGVGMGVAKSLTGDAVLDWLWPPPKRTACRLLRRDSASSCRPGIIETKQMRTHLMEQATYMPHRCSTISRTGRCWVMLLFTKFSIHMSVDGTE